MNICVFGDSITWGAFLPFRSAWANLLRNYLESKDDYIALYDLGIDGNTTRDLLARFGTEASSRKPELILFAIGTNDSGYRGTEDNPVVPLYEFRENLAKLIKEAQKFTNKIMFVGLAKGDDSNTVPLPRSTTGKCFTKKRIEIYNTAISEVCQGSGVIFVDVEGLLLDEDFDDGVHPNISGHVKIFEAVRKAFNSL